MSALREVVLKLPPACAEVMEKPVCAEIVRETIAAFIRESDYSDGNFMLRSNSFQRRSRCRLSNGGSVLT